MSLRVLTLNCWGVPIAKHRKERMTVIGETLAAASMYDVVCLQEVWTETDYRLIIDQIEYAAVKVRHLRYSRSHSASFAYYHKFRSGVGGSGLAILSRFPILETGFHQFNAQGKYYKVWHGDALGGKGVAYAAVDMCDCTANKSKKRSINDTCLGVIDFFITHTHAKYSEDLVYEEYHAHRIAQFVQLGKWIKNHNYQTVKPTECVNTGSSLSILAGDLNAKPHEIEIRVLKTISGLTDSYVGEEDAVDAFTCTRSNLFNEKTKFDFLWGSPDSFYPARIDYLMYRYREHGAAYKEFEISVNEQRVVHRDHVVTVKKGKKVPLSDHYGVKATFTKERVVETENEVLPLRNSYSSVKEAYEVLGRGIQEAFERKRFFNRRTLLCFVLVLLVQSAYYLWQFLASEEDEIYMGVSFFLVSAVLFVLTLLFFMIEKCAIPAEISALQEAKNQVELLLPTDGDPFMEKVDTDALIPSRRKQSDEYALV